MKLFKITIRNDGKPLDAFEYGKTALEAISKVYSRFPDAELIGHSFTKQYKILDKLENCQICNKVDCLHPVK